MYSWYILLYLRHMVVCMKWVGLCLSMFLFICECILDTFYSIWDTWLFVWNEWACVCPCSWIFVNVFLIHSTLFETHGCLYEMSGIVFVHVLVYLWMYSWCIILYLRHMVICVKWVGLCLSMFLFVCECILDTFHFIWDTWLFVWNEWACVCPCSCLFVNVFLIHSTLFETHGHLCGMFTLLIRRTSH